MDGTTANQWTASDVLAEAVARAGDLFGHYVRGAVVPWDAVETAAGFTRGHPHWSQFSKRFKRDFLKATGIAVWPVAGVGWKLLTITEQTDWLPRQRLRRARRQARRGRTEVAALPVIGLTARQAQRRAIQLDLMAHAERQALRSLRAVSATPTPISRPARVG